MYRALRAIRRGNTQGLVDWLRVTALLGLIFLSVQGYEWARLLQFGLTLSSSVYGATFYTIIGCHAAHVFGAVIWLLIILAMAKKHRFSPRAMRRGAGVWHLLVFCRGVVADVIRHRLSVLSCSSLISGS